MLGSVSAAMTALVCGDSHRTSVGIAGSLCHGCVRVPSAGSLRDVLEVYTCRHAYIHTYIRTYLCRCVHSYKQRCKHTQI